MQVEVWTQPLERPAEELARLRSLLAGDELARAGRFVFERDRRRYIVARGRLREVLASYLGTAPEALEFSYNAFGKPALKGGGLEFNLSHSGELAVYAVTEGREVGIDIEQLRRDFIEDGIPERFFAPGEVTALRSLPASAQTLGFFNCWTRKEAYVKARAEGLSIPLDSFEVTLRPGEPARFLSGGEGWSIQSFQPGPDYVGAVVAAAGSGWKCAFK